jgi:hypothetical protein
MKLCDQSFCFSPRRPALAPRMLSLGQPTSGQAIGKSIRRSEGNHLHRVDPARWPNGACIHLLVPQEKFRIWSSVYPGQFTGGSSTRGVRGGRDGCALPA